jgi:hypothetical protein
VSNEAAERLRSWIGETGIEAEYQLFEQALASERRATVERIRAALDADSFYGKLGQPRGRLNAILDAEARQ